MVRRLRRRAEPSLFFWQHTAWVTGPEGVLPPQSRTESVAVKLIFHSQRHLWKSSQPSESLGNQCGLEMSAQVRVHRDFTLSFASIGATTDLSSYAVSFWYKINLGIISKLGLQSVIKTPCSCWVVLRWPTKLNICGFQSLE